ncbi:MAG: hypothetical protein RSA24_02470 [Clostridia bacterium]
MADVSENKADIGAVKPAETANVGGIADEKTVAKQGSEPTAQNATENAEVKAENSAKTVEKPTENSANTAEKTAEKPAENSAKTVEKPEEKPEDKGAKTKNKKADNSKSKADGSDIKDDNVDGENSVKDDKVGGGGKNRKGGKEAKPNKSGGIPVVYPAVTEKLKKSQIAAIAVLMALILIGICLVVVIYVAKPSGEGLGSSFADGQYTEILGSSTFYQDSLRVTNSTYFKKDDCVYVKGKSESFSADLERTLQTYFPNEYIEGCAELSESAFLSLKVPYNGQTINSAFSVYVFKSASAVNVIRNVLATISNSNATSMEEPYFYINGSLVAIGGKTGMKLMYPNCVKFEYPPNFDRATGIYG